MDADADWLSPDAAAARGPEPIASTEARSNADTDAFGQQCDSKRTKTQTAVTALSGFRATGCSNSGAFEQPLLMLV